VITYSATLDVPIDTATLWSHVLLDGTLIRTDRCRVKNPESGHDLWFSGKHRAHGGNVQVVSDPDGHPVAVSDVQPGSSHDLAAARATGFLGDLGEKASTTCLAVALLGGRHALPGPEVVFIEAGTAECGPPAAPARSTTLREQGMHPALRSFQ